MGGHGHRADAIVLISIKIVAQIRGRLGLIECQCHLLDREALAPCTEMLVAGKPDLLQKLVDKERLLLELLLLLEDQPT